MNGYATGCSDGFDWTAVSPMDTCVSEDDYELMMLETPSTRGNEMQDVHDEVDQELGRGFDVEALFDYSRLPQESTHYRFCFMRAGIKAMRVRQPNATLPKWTETADQLWRLRDERTGNLVLVKEYKGDAKINWTDGGSHIFSDGYARVDENGVAWVQEEPFE